MTIPYNDITTKDYCKIYQTVMTVKDDAYLIEETHIPEGGLSGVRVSVQERADDGTPAWTECDADLTDWVWHLYNDFSAADPQTEEIPF